MSATEVTNELSFDVPGEGHVVFVLLRLYYQWFVRRSDVRIHLCDLWLIFRAINSLMHYYGNDHHLDNLHLFYLHLVLFLPTCTRRAGGCVCLRRITWEVFHSTEEP